VIKKNTNSDYIRSLTDPRYQKLRDFVQFVMSSDHPLIEGFLDQGTTHARLTGHFQNGKIVRIEVAGTELNDK
jgi:hypothetical protein